MLTQVIIRGFSGRLIPSRLSHFAAVFCCILGVLIAIGTQSYGQEVGATEGRLQSFAPSLDGSSQANNSQPNAESPEDEVCQLVIDVFVRQRQSQSAHKVQADIERGVYQGYAINLKVNSRLRKSPKIRVPIDRNRYRVWYGYSDSIRKAVLKTASAQTPPQVRSESTVQQVAFAEPVEPIEQKVDAQYPNRTSWWTLGKRYPDKPTMIKHLASVQHKGKFSLKWLDSLTREELHALHSDDHEGKVNWDFAVPPEVEDSKDPESIIDKVGNLKSVPQEQ